MNATALLLTTALVATSFPLGYHVDGYVKHKDLFDGREAFWEFTPNGNQNWLTLRDTQVEELGEVWPTVRVRQIGPDVMFIGDGGGSAKESGDGGRLHWRICEGCLIQGTIGWPFWPPHPIEDTPFGGMRMTAALHEDLAFEFYIDELSPTGPGWLKGMRPGDSDLDGLFTSTDLVEVFAGGRYEQGRWADWVRGDWNRDDVFDSGDLVFAFATGTYEQPAVASQYFPVASPQAVLVPEPTGWSDMSVMIVLICGIIWLGTRRDELHGIYRCADHLETDH